MSKRKHFTSYRQQEKPERLDYTISGFEEEHLHYEIAGSILTDDERLHFEQLVDNLMEANLPYSFKQDIILHWIGPVKEWIPYIKTEAQLPNK